MVRRAYEEGYQRRTVDIADLREVFSDDFVWHSRAEFPGRKQYRYDEVPQLWADLDETYAEFELVPQEYTEVGDYVVVTVENSARLRGSDVRIDSTIFHVWHVLNGKPQAAWGYTDRAEAFAAASGEPEEGP